MEYKEVINEVIEILEECEGDFITAYQICNKIELTYPYLWRRITTDYSSINPNIAMGEGTGNSYSPATFISNALQNYSKDNPHIVKDVLSCEGVLFGDVVPGFTGKRITIWALRY